LTDFFDLFDFARFLVERMIPSARKARWPRACDLRAERVPLDRRVAEGPPLGA